MKKLLSLILVLTIVTSTAIFFSISTSAKDGIDIIYVSASGSDSNDGLSQDHPIETFSKAIDLVADNGTIYLVGTVSAGESWKTYTKTVNITGGTLDFSSMSANIILGGNAQI